MKTVISASRRTDIPAFYMSWFMDRVRRGWFDVVNPFNGKVSRVSAAPEDVHTIVFWSKNFAPFLDTDAGGELAGRGFHLFFQFTINSESKVLEPGVPSLDERLSQLASLCRRWGPDAVNWRFDPICFYRDARGKARNNLHDFERIAAAAAACGIRRCTASFLDAYAKIRRRIPQPGIARFEDPGLAEKREHATTAHRKLQTLGMTLELCCEKSVLEALSPGIGVQPAACIPSHRLMKIYGGRISLRKDTGQRRRKGCACGVSADIGDYRRHPCFHNCLFCYANPDRWVADSTCRPTQRSAVKK